MGSCWGVGQGEHSDLATTMTALQTHWASLGAGRKGLKSRPYSVERKESDSCHPCDLVSHIPTSSLPQKGLPKWQVLTCPGGHNSTWNQQ